MTKNKHADEPVKKEHPVEKIRLHPRNRHRERYDFEILTKVHPELKPLLYKNRYGDITIDFADSKSVKALNTALLKQYYDIETWELPENYLCPPIPGRADYIHNVADLLANKNNGILPTGKQIRCLDIGVGANCIYPIIGVKEYNWSFVGSEIDPEAIQAAHNIINSNHLLKNNVTIRLQPESNKIFENILNKGDLFDSTICNPPFHASAAEAFMHNERKVKNLKIPSYKSKLNFGGQSHELWCVGGEAAFVQQIILESKLFRSQVFWFTTLISKQSNLKKAFQTLDKIGAKEYKIIPMGQGNKTSRLIAWTHLNTKEQKEWVMARWKKPL